MQLKGALAYKRSGQPEFKEELKQEWEQIARDLLRKI